MFSDIDYERMRHAGYTKEQVREAVLRDRAWKDQGRGRHCSSSQAARERRMFIKIVLSLLAERR